MLTPAQVITLRAACAAEPSLAEAIPVSNLYAIKAWLNAPSTFYVYRSTTPGSVVRNAISWAKLTLSDAPPSGAASVTDGSAARFNTLQLQCQSFQMNVQCLVQGLDTIATGMPSIRQGFQDSLSAVPSGAGGNPQSAGWGAVKTAITRIATNAERVLATGTGTQAAPGDLVWEGEVTNDEASLMY